MKTYKVTCFNGFTGKDKIRMVEAEDVFQARCSHKAVSNVMMANGWYVLQVADANGEIVYQGNKN